MLNHEVEMKSKDDKIKELGDQVQKKEELRRIELDMKEQEHT